MFLDDVQDYLLEDTRRPVSLSTKDPTKVEKVTEFGLTPGSGFFEPVREILDEDTKGSGIQDRLVALVETPGRPFSITGREQIGGSVFTMGGTTSTARTRTPLVERFGLWMQVRGARGGYQEIRQLGQEIYDLLNGMRGYESVLFSDPTSTDSRYKNDPRFCYQWVTADQPLYHMDVDENQRPWIGCNFTVTACRLSTNT